MPRVGTIVDFSTRFKDHDYTYSSCGIVRNADVAVHEFMKSSNDIHMAFKTKDNTFTFSGITSAMLKNTKEDVGWMAKYKNRYMTGPLQDTPESVCRNVILIVSGLRDEAYSTVQSK